MYHAKTLLSSTRLYGSYYLVWLALSYATQQPLVAVLGMVTFLALRNRIPDPSTFWRALSRMSALKHQVHVNAANVTARRDLAVLYLDLHRPRTALALLDDALRRDGGDPDLLFLRGLSLHRAGKHEAALEPLVHCVSERPTLRYGDPFLIAGDALYALERNEEAADAYERYAEINHSHVGVHLQLARLHSRRRDNEGVRRALGLAAETWRGIPASLSRKQTSKWFELQWLRARFLRDPLVIAVALVLVALVVLLAREVAPRVRF